VLDRCCSCCVLKMLHLACQGDNDLEVVRSLLRAGASLEARDIVCVSSLSFLIEILRIFPRKGPLRFTKLARMAQSKWWPCCLSSVPILKLEIR
jgi:hypothetical protein